MSSRPPYLPRPARPHLCTAGAAHRSCRGSRAAPPGAGPGAQRGPARCPWPGPARPYGRPPPPSPPGAAIAGAGTGSGFARSAPARGRRRHGGRGQRSPPIGRVGGAGPRRTVLPGPPAPHGAVPGLPRSAPAALGRGRPAHAAPPRRVCPRVSRVPPVSSLAPPPIPFPPSCPVSHIPHVPSPHPWTLLAVSQFPATLCPPRPLPGSPPPSCLSPPLPAPCPWTFPMSPGPRPLPLLPSPAAFLERAGTSRDSGGEGAPVAPLVTQGTKSFCPQCCPGALWPCVPKQHRSWPWAWP